MAELFLARESGVEVPRVIKRILPYLSGEAEFVQMFLDEARIAAQLFHDNIIHVHELGKLEDSIFIAMEYVDGADLRKLVQEELKRNAAVPYGIAAWVTAAVCEGLFYAHNRVGMDGKPLEIIHRDISPQNVMVGFDGRVKLVDFGIAKANSYMERSKPGVIKGKFLYLAPEQLSQDQIDHRADLFPLGTMLYEVTTGKSPFFKPSTEAVILAIRGEDPPPPHLVVPDYPQELSRIVMKCLTKDRNRRYQQASEIAADLRRFIATSAPTDQATVARYVQALLGEQGERTVVGSVAEADSPSEVSVSTVEGRKPREEPTQAVAAFPRDHESTRPSVERAALAPSRRVTSDIPRGAQRYDEDEDLRTQMAAPSDLQRALGVPPTGVTTIPARRSSGQSHRAADVAPEPEETGTLSGAEEVSQPTPSATPSTTPELLTDPAPPGLVQDGPVFDVVPGLDGVPRTRVEGSRAERVRNTGSVAPRRRPDWEDEDDESTMDYDTVASRSESRPTGASTSLSSLPPRRILVGAAGLALLIVVAAVLIRAVRSDDPPPASTEISVESAEVVVGSDPVEVQADPPPPEGAPPARAPEVRPADPIAAPPIASAAEVAKPPPPSRIPVIFRAPKGTRVNVGKIRVALGKTYRLEPGRYKATYRCPGRRGDNGSKTFRLESGQKRTEAVSIRCRRK